MAQPHSESSRPARPVPPRLMTMLTERHRQGEPRETPNLARGSMLGASPPDNLRYKKAHSSQYQILVLGLDGAGKSSILHYVSSTEVKRCISPTEGFNFVQFQDSGLLVDILEVGGSQNLRSYWNQFLSKAHILVFVVDAADGPRLPAAREELHCLLAEDAQLPLIVLANKQDKKNALGIAELQKELALNTFNNQREFFLLPTSATYEGLDTANSVLHLKNLLIRILTQI